MIVILLSKICFPNSSFISNISTTINNYRWFIVGGSFAHFINQDASKIIGIFASFLAFCNFLMVSTIICLNFSSSYHTYGPLFFKGFPSLKATTLSVLLLMATTIKMPPSSFWVSLDFE
jgi:hypothetical protein